MRSTVENRMGFSPKISMRTKRTAEVEQSTRYLAEQGIPRASSVPGTQACSVLVLALSRRLSFSGPGDPPHFRCHCNKGSPSASPSPGPFSALLSSPSLPPLHSTLRPSSILIPPSGPLDRLSLLLRISPVGCPRCTFLSSRSPLPIRKDLVPFGACRPCRFDPDFDFRGL